MDGYWVFRWKGITSPPDTWGVIVGEILHDLRSALDQLAWELIRLNRCRPTRLNQFPIAKDQTEWDRMTGLDPRGRDQLRGISDPQRAKIKALQPSFGGDASLLRLRVLRNVDQHRSLHAALVSIPSDQGARTWIKVVPPTSTLLRVDYRPGPVKDDAIVLRVLVDASPGSNPPNEVQVNPELPLRPTFGKSHVRIPEFHDMSRAVTRVIDEFEPDFG